MRDKVAVIGPYPPPDGGTTIPFRLFCNYLDSNYSEWQLFRIVRTTTFDKSLVKPLGPVAIFRELWRILRVLVLARSSDKLILFGSQKFVTVTGSLLVLLYKPLGKKVYIRINGGACDVFYERSSIIYRWLMRRVLSHADAILVQTELLRSNMKVIWGDKVCSAPNYRTRSVGHAQGRFFRDDSVSFMYAGMVRKLKGIEELLAAFEKLRDRLEREAKGITVELDIYGPLMTSDLEPLEISQYLDCSSIRFHGQMGHDELLGRYYQADVFVFPTYWPTEGHSGAVVEALLYGLPVISTSWRAMPEIVVDQQNGLLCEPRSVEGLADAMYRICCDLPLRKRLSMNATETAGCYGTEKICEEIANVFTLRPDGA